MPNNSTATTEQLTEARLTNAKSLLNRAMTKASSEDPPYSDDIAIRREIQACQDIVNIEDSTLTLVKSGVPVPSTVWPSTYVLQSEFVIAPMANLTTGF